MRLQDLDIEHAKVKFKLDNITQTEHQIRLEYEQKTANYDSMRDQAKMCQDVMDRTIVKMSALKQEFARLQKEKEDLINERNDLVIHINNIIIY